MDRNWAVFSAVSVVMIALAALAVVGATQGLFGFSGGEDESTVIRLKRVETAEGTTFVARASDEGVDDSAHLAAPLANRLVLTSPARDVTAPVATGSAASATPAPSSVSTAATGETGNSATNAAPASAPATQTAPSEPSDRPDESGTLPTYQLGSAGEATLSVSEDELRIASVLPADGWTVFRSDSDDVTVQVWLRSADEEVRFTATEVNGQIEVSLVSEPLESSAAVATAAEQTTFQVTDAGSVTVEVLNGRLAIVSADATNGWRVAEEETEDREIEVDFKQGERKLTFKARLVSGEIVTQLFEEDPGAEHENDDHEEEDDD